MPDIAGLKLIVPTSVAGSGVSVSASGKVTFTAATSVSVNGCFSATYDNYLIVVRFKIADDNYWLLNRLRASGSDATGSNYVNQRLAATSTTIVGARSTDTSFLSGRGGTANMSGTHIYLYGPNLAQPTAHRCVMVSGDAGAYIDEFAGTHSLSSQYDGFSLAPELSSSLTGALTIYGLSQ